MKFKSNISIKRIGGEHVLVSNDKGHLNFTRIITLNESAEYLISRSLNKEFDSVGWRDLLIQKYGISNEQAHTDAEALIEKLKEADVLA